MGNLQKGVKNKFECAVYLHTYWVNTNFSSPSTLYAFQHTASEKNCPKRLIDLCVPLRDNFSTPDKIRTSLHCDLYSSNVCLALTCIVWCWMSIWAFVIIRWRLTLKSLSSTFFQCYASKTVCILAYHQKKKV